MRNLLKYYNLNYFLLIIFISIIFWFYLLGSENINPMNDTWLLSGDLSTYQLGWKYFRNDIWRFPLGLSPNYGLYLNGSIVYSDSIPLFAIIFKVINNFLPDNFQYFSLWILLCLYFQIFFSFKLIFKLTNNHNYSLLGSLFFCFATILINRIGLNLSLFGQWVILSYFYIEILNTKKKKLFKNLNILLSVTIHFYFTIILLSIFCIEELYDFVKKKKKFKKVFFDLLILFLSIGLLMFILGYFNMNIDDNIGWGYGYYNLNLNSFFNPQGQTNFENFSWSFFFNNKENQNGEYEGFSYLGVSGIVFLFISIYNIILKKYKIIYSNKKTLLISTFFIILSLSNNLNFGSTEILSIQLNDFLYAALGFIRASGRLIWPVFYLIFFIGIIFIYQNFKKKHSIVILLCLFFLQILDLSSGLSEYKLGKQYNFKKNSLFVKDKIWINLSDNFEEIRLAEPENQSKIYQLLSKTLLEENFIKTDIIYLARVNRSLIVNKRYELKKLFFKKNLDIFKNTIFVSDNISLVKYIYNNYKDKLYYHEADNLWLISNKSLDNTFNKNSSLLSEIHQFNTDMDNFFNFKNLDLLPGIGWKKSNHSNDLIFDGYHASLLMNIEGSNCNKNSILNLKVSKFFNYLNKPIKLRLIINNNEEKNILVSEVNDNLSFNFECKRNTLNSFYFNIENPKSLYDIKKGLNRDKRSLIINSFKIIN